MGCLYENFAQLDGFGQARSWNEKKKNLKNGKAIDHQKHAASLI